MSSTLPIPIPWTRQTLPIIQDPSRPSFDCWNGIFYLTTHQVLLCQQCRVAIPHSLLASHLKHSHRAVPAPRRRAIIAQFATTTALSTWDDILPQPDHSPPLKCLLDPIPGFRCPYCPNFRSPSPDCFRQHVSLCHADQPKVDLKLCTIRCHLQAWTNRLTYRRYWTVDSTHIAVGPRTLEPLQPHRDDLPTLHRRQESIDDILQAEDEEESRLLEEQHNVPAFTQELEQDENTDWLRGCEWPKWFANRPLALIVAATQQPSSCRNEDLVLGSWQGIDCVSPAADERVLRRLVTATNLMFARCEETLHQTPRVLRCWVKSWSSLYLPYPFDMVQKEATRRRYCSYFQRFLCYIYRIWHLATRIKERLVDITGLQLTSEQCAMMQYVWDGFVDIPDSIETSTNSSQPDSATNSHNLAVLVENLFQLSMMFWTDLQTDGGSHRSPIAHYSGVLGIHPYELAFRSAYHYTPYLSALIWIGRLMVLEYSLPLRAYQHLTHPWPNRSHYPDQIHRLQQIRMKYLFRGSLSPIGYLLERLRHGRAIARHEGPPTNISWSVDSQVLYIADGKISMPQFRSIIHTTIVRARQLTQDLLLGWQPQIEVKSYCDDLVNRRPGYSFLNHPKNGLQDSFRLLNRQAFTLKCGFGLKTNKGRDKIHNYLKLCDRLISVLYSAVHYSAGMPGRCEEVRHIRWANTMTVRRNIFLYQGQVILIFSYNKAITNQNNSFYVVRAPCPAVQQLLFIYLTYIRPFRDFLARQIDLVVKNAMTNPHMFTLVRDAESCFTASMCLKSLRQSSIDSPVQFSTSLYRQVAVSIAKKHLVSLTQNFNPYTPFDENGLVRLLSWQSGHAPETHNRHYALEREFPAKLQPELIDRYLENSRIWHEFNLIRENDVIEAVVDTDINPPQRRSRPSAPGYAPDSPLAKTPNRDCSLTADANGRAKYRTEDRRPYRSIASEDDKDNSDPEWQEYSNEDSDTSDLAKVPYFRAQTPPRTYKRKRQVTEELSPMSRKIARMQADLAQLVEAKKRKQQPRDRYYQDKDRGGKKKQRIQVIIERRTA